MKHSKKKPQGSKKKEQTRAEKAMEDFLEHKTIRRDRTSDDRRRGEQLASRRAKIEDPSLPGDQAPEGKPFALEMDLKTRYLVSQFFKDGEDHRVKSRRHDEKTPEEVFMEKEEPLEKPVMPEAVEAEIVEEKAPEEVIEKKEEPLEEPAMPEAVEAEIVEEKTPEEVIEKKEEPLEEPAMSEAESDESTDEAKQAIFFAMKKKELKEEKDASPKEKEKAEKVNMMLNAAEGLYKGTRRATRETLNFAGDFIKGTAGVATGVVGGVFSLAGNIFLGVVRVAGMGYRGVGVVTSGLTKKRK